MSLGTVALKVGRERESLSHSKEVSMATLRAGTTPACSRQLAPSHRKSSVENTHLTLYLPMHRRGGTDWEPESAKIRLSNRSAKISSKMRA